MTEIMDKNKQIVNNRESQSWPLDTMINAESNGQRRTVLLNQDEQSRSICCNKSLLNENDHKNILNRFYPLTCLICTLLFVIVLNIFLIIWIVISLNLHHNSVFVRRQTMNDLNILRISGNLTTNKTLYTNLIEDQYVSSQKYQDFLSDLIAQNFLKIHQSDILELESFADSYEETEQKNNIRFLPNGNIELKINKKLLIENEKPKRLLLIEPNRLIIEDSSAMPHIKRQMGGLRMAQLKTDSIIGCVDQDLRIESRTEKLKMAGNKLINIESINGQIEIKSYGNILMNSEQLKMNSRKISFANLNNYKNITHIDEERMVHHHHRHNKNEKYIQPMAYQVCICANGQLFAAEESTLCQADQTVCDSFEQ